MIHPLAVLLDFLTERRAAGETFADVWPVAVHAAIVDVDDLDERKQWRQALQGTISAWEASYELRPPERRERALSLVADPVDRESIATTRACAHCAGPLPVDARTNARHCSKKCRDKASYARRGVVKNQRRREERLARAA